MMGYWFAFGSMMHDAPERHIPSASNRSFVKMAIMFACVLSAGAIADYLGISRNKIRPVFLITMIPGTIAGIFIKFRNFSWWRNCRIYKWFY
jgi:hypothetical protein